MNGQDYWIPQDAFRYLTHKNGRILVVISVILDDLDNPDSLEQPLVSAAWFKFRKEVGDWEVVFFQNYFKRTRVQSGWKNDGRILLETEIIGEYKILSSQALAVPLVEIQSERDIEEKIISPLVKSLDGKIN